LDVGSISPAEAAERAKGKPVSPLSSLETKLAFLESKMAALETKNAASEAKVERDTVEVNNSAPKGSSEKESSGTNKADNKADADKPTEKLDDDLFERDDAATPHESLAVDEIKLFDNYAHWLSAGFGYVTNNSPNGQGAYNFSAGNLKYGITIGRRIIFDRPHVQDSLVLEGGIYVYKAINFAAQGDSYTLLSTAANLRYNIFFSESFGIFGYAGMLQSNVLGSSLPVASAITALNSVLPSVGAGILLQIGPSWYAKLVIGLDDTSLNLLLRF
jgi:hypothetical protein